MTKLIVSALFAIFMTFGVVDAGATVPGVAKTCAAVRHPF